MPVLVLSQSLEIWQVGRNHSEQLLTYISCTKRNVLKIHDTINWIFFNRSILYIQILMVSFWNLDKIKTHGIFKLTKNNKRFPKDSIIK